MSIIYIVILAVAIVATVLGFLIRKFSAMLFSIVSIPRERRRMWRLSTVMMTGGIVISAIFLIFLIVR